MADTTRGSVPSRWGMPLEQYVLTYGTGKPQPDWVGGTCHEKVLADIKKVSALGLGELHYPSGISITTLRSILHSHSPIDYVELGSPAFISGCIKLMSSIRLIEKGSPFSYELGYACFRMVAIGLAVCLLRRAAELEMRIGKIIRKANPKALTENTIQLHITHLVQDLAIHLGGREKDAYNCIVGWSACPEHPKCSAPPIVSLSDTCTLLNILYEDRRLLLQAFALLCPTGISAVIFLLWRYVSYERFRAGYQETRKHAGPLQTVLWRCFLITANVEQETFATICSRDDDLWPGRKTGPLLSVELEDSKVLAISFIKRLQRVENKSNKPLLFVDLLNALIFVKHHFLPGCQDLVAHCYGAVIEQVWYALERKEQGNFENYSDLDIPSAFGRVVDMFSETIMLLTQWKDTTPATVEQIIQEIIRTDLLDLIGRIIFLLNPSLDSNRESEDYQVNAHVLKGSQGLLEDLSRLASPPILEARFRFYGPNWWKIALQMSFLSQVAPPGKLLLGGRQRGFYDICWEIWRQIGRSIQHPVAETPSSSFCSYIRCPDPIVTTGSMYQCSKCHKAEYCSPRCQALDWLYDHETISHHVSCPDP
ncbi:unnamed protein product [Rhizoctonia solani]|uniref:MYND-type domain-containing protein n=1 Tax=Rhizoctonia solani TaxID=456999 RepID=A0A8H3H2B9_9AGAM|nr:unnamed protein product [Rhizoctonia solani]